MTDTPSPSLPTSALWMIVGGGILEMAGIAGLVLGGPLLFLIPVLIGAIFSIFAIRNIIRRTKAPSEPQ